MKSSIRKQAVNSRPNGSERARRGAHRRPVGVDGVGVRRSVGSRGDDGHFGQHAAHATATNSLDRRCREHEHAVDAARSAEPSRRPSRAAPWRQSLTSPAPSSAGRRSSRPPARACSPRRRASPVADRDQLPLSALETLQHPRTISRSDRLGTDHDPAGSDREHHVGVIDRRTVAAVCASNTIGS